LYKIKINFPDLRLQPFKKIFWIFCIARC